MPRPCRKTNGKKAVVLFSGGLDSTTCLYWALSKGYKCFALNINYGQKHLHERAAAVKIAKAAGVNLVNITLDMPWLKGATSLVKGSKLKMPNASLAQIKAAKKVPNTYVPARNLVFVSVAASMAESLGASAIIAGPNAVDFSGYPDCRPAFYKPLGRAVKEGTCGGNIKILTPLIKLSKAQIVKLGLKLGAPLGQTRSCYQNLKKPCGKCDACKLRAAGFKAAGV